MPLKTYPYDPADYLRDEEDMIEYLRATAEDGTAAEVLAALNTIARARNMAQLARNAGLTRAGLYKALGPDGNPSFETVSKVARAMGFGLTFTPLSGDGEKAERAGEAA